jgi:hypothetical protein
MGVLLIARNKHFTPPEAIGQLMPAFAGWREQYKGWMESFFFFAGVAGGGGILNVPDEAALNRMMVEWPLRLFSEIEIHPIVDGDVAIGQYIEIAQAMGAPR